MAIGFDLGSQQHLAEDVRAGNFFAFRKFPFGIRSEISPLFSSSFANDASFDCVWLHLGRHFHWFEVVWRKIFFVLAFGGLVFGSVLPRRQNLALPYG